MKKILILLATLLTFTSCSAPQPETNNLKIVTTIPPLFSLTAHLIKDTNAEIFNIIPPNTSIHTYNLTPLAVKKLHQADLIILNGLKLEEFLSNTLESIAGTQINTSKNIVTQNKENKHDPHIWLSPTNAIKQAENIMNALIKKDPENTSVYKENYQNLTKKLQTTDKNIQIRVNALNQKPYSVFHNGYHYFEEHFDIHPSAIIEEFPGKEPSAKSLVNIIKSIKQENIQTIFTEPQFSPKLVNTLQNEYDLKTASLDPLGQTIDTESYFTMMEQNISSLEQAFNK